MIVEGFIGILLGIMIGIISAVIVISLFTILAQGRMNTKSVLQIIGELCAVPTFSFGGPWIGTQLLSRLNWDHILLYYIAALCITFIILISPVLYKYIIKATKLVEDSTL
jgi:alpha/beta superfamily hydrolase